MMGTREIKVEMRGMGGGMLGMGELRGIRMGMPGIRVGMRGTRVGMGVKGGEGGEQGGEGG